MTDIAMCCAATRWWVKKKSSSIRIFWILKMIRYSM